jgi:hypothetical protein
MPGPFGFFGVPIGYAERSIFSPNFGKVELNPAAGVDPVLE